MKECYTFDAQMMVWDTLVSAPYAFRIFSETSVLPKVLRLPHGNHASRSQVFAYLELGYTTPRLVEKLWEQCPGTRGGRGLHSREVDLRSTESGRLAKTS